MGFFPTIILKRTFFYTLLNERKDKNEEIKFFIEFLNFKNFRFKKKVHFRIQRIFKCLENLLDLGLVTHLTSWSYII